MGKAGFEEACLEESSIEDKIEITECMKESLEEAVLQEGIEEAPCLEEPSLEEAGPKKASLEEPCIQYSMLGLSKLGFLLTTD